METTGAAKLSAKLEMNMAIAYEDKFARKAQEQLLKLMLQFMVISGHFRSHDKFMRLMKKISYKLSENV